MTMSKYTPEQIQERIDSYKRDNGATITPSEAALLLDGQAELDAIILGDLEAAIEATKHANHDDPGFARALKTPTFK
jgi:hypothetical protein